MNSEPLLQANRAFKLGRYEEALEHYELAAERYGGMVVRANLHLCKLKIGRGSGGDIDQNPWVKDQEQSASELLSILKDGLGVERIYVVNLRRRKDRYARIVRELNAQGLPFKKIEGVDAKYSRKANIQYQNFLLRPLEEKRPSSSHVPDSRYESMKKTLTVGAFGYMLSQEKVFSDAKAQGYRRILVLDDDVFWHSQSTERLKKVANELKEKAFKVLLLGSSEYSDRSGQQFLSSFYERSQCLHYPIADLTCGSFAVVYDRSVYTEILEAIRDADGTFDNMVLGSLFTRYRGDCFAVTPSICIPDVDDSDIRDYGRTQLSHSKRMLWETVRFNEFKRNIRVGVIVSSERSLKSVSALTKARCPGININIYYPSDDGFRTVIPGHEYVTPLGLQIDSFSSQEPKRFGEVVRESDLFAADLYVSWPAEEEITYNSLMTRVCKILEEINLGRDSEGLVDGIMYLANYKRPLVRRLHSIIIPCYRGVAESLPSIQSALLQDARDFEVIVVNDNPDNVDFEKLLRDELGEWVRSLNKAEILNKVMIIQHKRNRNGAAARNTGFMRSRGEWITFLDDDDRFEPMRLTAIEETLMNSSERIGACYCGYSGTWNGKRDFARFLEGNLLEKVLALRYSEHYLHTNTVTYKRSALEELGGFDEGYRRHQDLELMCRYFERFDIAPVKKFLVNNKPVSVSSTFDPNIAAIARVKIKFLTDVARNLDLSDVNLVREIVDAHVKDIFKASQESENEANSAARAMLEEAMLRFKH